MYFQPSPHHHHAPPTPPPSLPVPGAPLPHVLATVGNASFAAFLHPENIFSVISVELAASIQPLSGPFPRRPHASFGNYGQIRIAPVGAILINVTVFNHNVALPVYIARDPPFPFMLGCDFMCATGIFMAHDMKELLIDGVWLPISVDPPSPAPHHDAQVVGDSADAASLHKEAHPPSSPSPSAADDPHSHLPPTSPSPHIPLYRGPPIPSSPATPESPSDLPPPSPPLLQPHPSPSPVPPPPSPLLLMFPRTPTPSQLSASTSPESVNKALDAPFTHPSASLPSLHPVSVTHLCISLFFSCFFHLLSCVLHTRRCLPIPMLAELLGYLCPRFLTPPWPPDSLQNHILI